MAKNFSCKDRTAHVPEPVYDAVPEFVELYHKAWELVDQHVMDIPGMPQTPYMDEAFCRTQIWIWDTCFMSLFCKYAPDHFPGVESLRNFYEVMYGNKTLPMVMVPDDEPRWTLCTPGEMGQIKIHIADNPPLFAWSEYENWLFTGDTEHVKKLLFEEQYLQKHYWWLENLKGSFTAPWLRVPARWHNHGIGYAWEGGCSGMDNSPRGRLTVPCEGFRPGTPDNLWLDALAQQALAAECIGRLFEAAGEEAESLQWLARSGEKKKLLRELYWDDEDGIFYDLSLEKRTFNKVPTIASFWPLTAGAASEEQALRMAEKLFDPDYFGGSCPFTSLARKDPDFVPEGGNYCRGTVWVPTAYATVRGLVRYGKYAEASEAAVKLLHYISRTYQSYEPHSIWESYSPDGTGPARQIDNVTVVRKDFCGWSALAPISMFIENVIGIHSVNAAAGKVCWHPDTTLPGKTGIRNLKFGKTVCSMICEKGLVTVRSNEPFTLEIDGKEFKIPAGERQIKLKEA